MFVPEDKESIQRMLNLTEVPDDIEREYMYRIRMYHKSGMSGPLGAVGLVDLLRFLGHCCEPGRLQPREERVEWRTIGVNEPVEVRVDGVWTTTPATFQGEIQAGLIAVERFNRIDEFNAFDVRLPESGLPDDVDAESFKSDVSDLDGKPDARINLVEQETGDQDDGGGHKSAFDDPPKVNWGNVKKGTPIWFRDDLGNEHEAKFMRCLANGEAEIRVEHDSSIKTIIRTDIALADS